MGEKKKLRAISVVWSKYLNVIIRDIYLVHKGVTNMKKTHLGALVAVTAAFLSITTVTQADIIFGAATDITTEADDIITIGTLHAAVNAAESSQADVTLNGVLFESGDVNAATNIRTTGFTSSNDAELNPNNLGDTAEYNRFLGDIDFANGASGDITIENLIEGNEYALQVFFVDNRPPQDNRVTTISAVGGTGSVALNDQFAVGNFVADSTGEFTFNVATAGSNDPNITGFQVRDLGAAVPEPSSLAVLGLIGLGLTTARRRK